MKAWQLLARLITYRPGLYLLDALLAILTWALFIVPGILTRRIFDALSEQSSLSFGIWALLALLFIAQAARMLGNITILIVDSTFTESATALLRRNLFAHILNQPGARAVPDSPGETVTRFREDVDETVAFIGSAQLLDMLGAAVFATAALVIMLRINTAITVWVFLPLVLVIIAAQAAMTRIERYRKVGREATGRVTGLLGEMFGAVQAVQVADATMPVIAQLRRLNEERRSAIIQDRIFTEGLNSVFFNAVNLGTGLILLLAARAMRTGSFTVGDFALFVFFLTWVSQLTRRFGSALAVYEQVRVSLKRLLDLLQGSPAQALVQHTPTYLDGKHSLPAIITSPERTRLEEFKVVGLTYRYPNTNQGVEGIDLIVPRGSLIVITGRVGAGKTTLLRAMLGLLPKQAGTHFWNGHFLANPASFLIPPHCAYTPQVPRIFTGTLKENILLGVVEKQTDLVQAINLAVFETDLAAMPDGLETALGRSGMRLSGGQAQRVAAARMFVRGGEQGAELLVVDDLSSALDVETEHRLWQRLLALREATILAVSHRHSVLMQADHIVVLENGQIKEQGRPNELLSKETELWQL